MAKSKINFVLVILLCSLLAVVHAQAENDNTTAVHGKALFNVAELSGSTNDKSCNSCHPDGKGLEKVKTEDELAEIINKCIVGALNGKSLAKISPEMRALLDYLIYIQGRALFNDPNYGGSENDKSCNTCHPGGKGLMEAGKKENNLTSNIKRCITAALKGDPDSIDFGQIKAVRSYIWALQAGIENK